MEFSSGGKERAPQFSSLEEDVKQEVSRQQKQEEWEKAKESEIEANDGLPIDRRPLWMKLQEQKDRAQAEWEEDHNLKSMVQGLDEEEAAFLNKVVDMQDRVEFQRFSSETEEIKEYRAATAQLVTTVHDPSRELQLAAAAAARRKPVKSQVALLSGLVKTKRKRSTSDSEPPSKQSEAPSKQIPTAPESVSVKTLNQDDKAQQPAAESSPMTMKSIAEAATGRQPSLPGLVAYCDGDDSDSSDSASD